MASDFQQMAWDVSRKHLELGDMAQVTLHVTAVANQQPDVDSSEN